jgi:tRNA(adenine34) deaminase
VSRVVYGASDDKRGYTRAGTPLLHPKTQIISGVLATESEALLKAFFQRMRER